MKILLVSPHFPPASIGGVEIYVKRLADELLKRGDTAAVISIDRVNQPGPTQVVTERVFGYPVHRISAPLAGGELPLGVLYEHPAVRRAIADVFDSFAPDVLHLHSGYLLGGPALGVGRERRVPTIVTLHDFWFICSRITLIQPQGDVCSGPESPGKCAWCLATEQRRFRVPDRLSGGALGRLAIQALDRVPIAAAALGLNRRVPILTARHHTLISALAAANVILSPSHFLKNIMIDNGVPAATIAVSRYGIEYEAVKRVGRVPGQPIRIGYLGQLAPHKGVHVLVEAVRQMPSTPLSVRLYGDPTPHPHYAERLRRSAQGDQRIEFAGPYTHDRVYDILSELDVIVVPSVWYENSPFVIQEAQAAGVPAVASRLGGMQELIADERYGLLFTPGDPGDLARQLGRLATDPALLERLAPGPAIVRSAENEFDELMTHYRRLAAAASIRAAD